MTVHRWLIPWSIYIAIEFYDNLRLWGRGRRPAWRSLGGRTLIFLVAQLFLMAVQPDRGTSKPPNMILSLVYYPGHCHERIAPKQAKVEFYHCRRIPDLKWTIHGLWNHDTFDPVFADDMLILELMKRVSEEVSNEVKLRMSRQWKSLSSRDNLQFWAYEFGKHHGSLAENPHLDTMQKYFSKTLELASQVFISEWLRRQKIEPDDHKGYSALEIEKAIIGRHKGKPRLTCRHLFQRNLSVLSEIGVCFDADFKPTDCRSSLVTHVQCRTVPIKVRPES
ncbi:ribonuclease T2-like [Galendromus occidentalis]|uniref:Ribonuclease T2-like n=1 Tax=Galendromus occidentalis TaxID=34638 RepID=A0AAJ6QRQ2_9ACAR|nr:ribonuclease T2-like [Galendromus occidentalis]